MRLYENNIQVLLQDKGELGSMLYAYDYIKKTIHSLFKKKKKTSRTTKPWFVVILMCVLLLTLWLNA